MLYSFGTLTWRAAGIDDVTISLLWAESVAVEIVLMLFGGWLLKRLGVCGLIALALGCGMVRWLGMAFTTELWALVLLQVLHAGSFAACHLGAMAFIQRALPPHGVGLGQSVYYALGTGATQAVVFQIAGLLYAEFGQHAFLGMFVVSAIGMAALLLLARTWTAGARHDPGDHPFAFSQWASEADRTAALSAASDRFERPIALYHRILQRHLRSRHRSGVDLFEWCSSGCDRAP